MPVTFQVVGNLADFGNDVRAGVKVRATATPGIKVGDVAVHSNQPETVVTDAAGAFTLELVSLPGVWYRIQTPYANAINTVHLAGYVPDVGDPTTGTVFPADTVINLKDVVSEDPTPGYEAIAYVGGGGGGGGTSVHGDLTGRSAADQHPMSAITGLDAALAGKASSAHGHAIADTTGLQAALDAKADDLGADDNYVTDAEKVKLSNLSGVNTGDQTLPTWTTIAGKPAVVAEGATQADARTAIGAGTSSFSGVYADLTSKPTLGTAAATASTDYATATQGTTADSAVQPGDDAADLGSAAATDGYVLTADGAGGAAWEAGGGGSDPWTYVFATIDTTNSTTTAANIAGLSLSGLADGLYQFEAQLRGTAAAGTTGIQTGMTWGASAPVVGYGVGHNSAGAPVHTFTNSAATSALLSTTGSLASPWVIPAAAWQGTFRATSMSHDIVFTVRSEVAASDVVIKADSFIRYRRISS